MRQVAIKNLFMSDEDVPNNHNNISSKIKGAKAQKSSHFLAD